MVLNNGKKNGEQSKEVAPLAGSLRSLLHGRTDSGAASRSVVEPFRDKWPLLAEVLGGVAATATEDAVEGGTVTLFVRDGQLRFSINVKSADTTIIGDVADVLSPLDSIEFAMTTGKVSSKGYSERFASLPKVPGDVKLY